MRDEGTQHRQVIIVGAGPVGLAMALDWAQRGHHVLLLAANAARSEGSRAICFAKRTLEICDRLGCGDAVVAKGVSWNVGKVFRRDGLLYEFNLLPEPGHERPAFVNLQQYYFEQFQLEALEGGGSRTAAGEPPSSPTLLPEEEGSVNFPLPRGEGPRVRDVESSRTRIDLRWNHRVTGITQYPDQVTLSIQSADRDYALTCDWLIACDGAGSPLRKMLGLKSEGQVFQDRFLIADVKMRGASVARFKTERWFWFDPPFHRHQSALLHKQADDVWRIDFQLGWQADPEREKQPERVLPRVQAMLGDDAEFSLEWVSVYTFQCRRMERFVHDRVIFAGDAAHQVSPFGARGANSGIQDADNLGWKLDLVVRGLASAALLETYNAERSRAADENILNSTRSTDFITPKNEASRLFRDATLELAAKHPFARRLVNSGRLSVPTHYAESPLNTPDAELWPEGATAVTPGSPALDAPLENAGRPEWLLRHLGGEFKIALFAADGEVSAQVLDALQQATLLPIPVRAIVIAQAAAAPRGDATWLVDREGLAFARYAPGGAAIYLFRPDQHVAGRRTGLATDWLGAALRRACMTDVSFTVGVC